MEGTKTPMGDAGNLRPHRLAEEAQVTPHGKRSTWNGNQHSSLTEQNKKRALIVISILS